MNILHLEASSGWGGQEIRILREAEGMRKRGYQIFFAVMKNGLLIERARAAGFLVYEINFYKWGWFFAFFSLWKIFRKHKIDLVNTHSSLDSWIGGIAAKIFKIQVIRTRHLSGMIKKGWNSRFLYGKLADFVVTTCESIIPMISSQSGKPYEKCRSIATGVDPGQIVYKQSEKEAFQKNLNMQPGQILIGTACFMRSWKGIEDFLQAASRLRQEKTIRWVIIGGGHAETYKKRARELSLEHLVHFTGHLNNPYPALAALDVFVLLSTANEGVSQALLQAAYLEKPLIATATGGLCEVCLDRKTGIQVAPFSSDQVAKAVLELYKNPELRLNFGRAAHRLVQEHFSFQKTLDQMEEVYHLVLKSMDFYTSRK